MKKQFILGMVTGGLIFGAAGVFAGQYVATDNPFPVEYNGNNVSIEGYNINDSTYFKLRDIADVVGGFAVDFNNNTIKLSSSGNTASSGSNDSVDDSGYTLKTELPVNIQTFIGEFTVNSLSMKYMQYLDYLNEVQVSYIANVTATKDGTINFNLNYLDKDGFSIGSTFVYKSDAKAGETYDLTDIAFIPYGTVSITITKD